MEREGHSSSRERGRKKWLRSEEWSLDKVERLIVNRKVSCKKLRGEGREERRMVYWSNFGTITEE